MTVRWIETTREVYSAIYVQHFADFGVFGTISHDDHPDYGYHMMTEWGFKGADFPIIKIDRRDRENKATRYFIAAVNKECDE